MKLVIAIVRPDRLPRVLEALFRAEVTGLTISRVQGHGGETEQVENYRGTTVKMELSEKVRIEIGVSDHFVTPTVEAIAAAMAFSAIGTFALLKLIGLVTPLRAPGRSEGLGLDVTEHGEEAYTTGEGAILVLRRESTEEPPRLPQLRPVGDGA